MLYGIKRKRENWFRQVSYTLILYQKASHCKQENDVLRPIVRRFPYTTKFSSCHFEHCEESVYIHVCIQILPPYGCQNDTQSRQSPELQTKNEHIHFPSRHTAWLSGRGCASPSLLSIAAPSPVHPHSVPRQGYLVQRQQHHHPPSFLLLMLLLFLLLFLFMPYSIFW